MRREDRKIEDFTQVLKLLEYAKVLRLGLVLDGFAYIVPVNFGFEVVDEEIRFFIHSAGQGTKIELMRQSELITFEIDNILYMYKGEIACKYSCIYESMMGKAKVEFLDSNEDKKRALDIFMSQNGFEGAPEYSPNALKHVCVYTLHVENFTCKSNKPKE